MYASHLLPQAGGAAYRNPGPPLDAPTLDAMLALQPVERLAAGEAAFWEGDAASHLFQIVEGCLRLYRILADGRRAIIGFRFGGETLGMACQNTYGYTAEAVTAVRLRRISRSRIRAATDGADLLQPVLMTRIFEEMAAAQRHIIVLGQLGAEERVANFLLSSARRTGSDRKRPVAIELPMTRLDIADYLGLTIETVCRVISKFRREGIIAPEGRHRIVLNDIEAMLHLAGEMDEYAPFDPAGMTQRTTAWTN